MIDEMKEMNLPWDIENLFPKNDKRRMKSVSDFCRGMTKKITVEERNKIAEDKKLKDEKLARDEVTKLNPKEVWVQAVRQAVGMDHKLFAKRDPDYVSMTVEGVTGDVVDLKEKDGKGKGQGKKGREKEKYEDKLLKKKRRKRWSRRRSSLV